MSIFKRKCVFCHKRDDNVIKFDIDYGGIEDWYTKHMHYHEECLKDISLHPELYRIDYLVNASEIIETKNKNDRRKKAYDEYKNSLCENLKKAGRKMV